MFLLVSAHPGCPGQIPQSHKTVVCVCAVERNSRHLMHQRPTSLRSTVPQELMVLLVLHPLHQVPVA